MQSSSRTLVMSPPELWELIDQPDRMQGLMCGLIGRATEVTVNQRKPESLLRWEASDKGADAWIEVELAEKGWGTNVKLKAENGTEATKLEGWLDAVLDELATPTKRPFEGIGEAQGPEEPAKPIEMPTPEAPDPEPEPEPQPVVAAVEEAPPEPEPEPPAPEPKKKKRRRFFGF
jgi:hypothetical protein